MDVITDPHCVSKGGPFDGINYTRGLVKYKDAILPV